MLGLVPAQREAPAGEADGAAPQPSRLRRAWRATVAALWWLNGIRPPNDVHGSDYDQLMRSMHG